MVHLYFGDGKGKTSAAIGMAIRAAGNDKKVAFVQFMKGIETGEVKILEGLPNIKVIRNNNDYGFFKDMTTLEKDELFNIHEKLLYEGISYIGEDGVLVLDEITHAINFKLVDENNVINIIDNCTEEIEIVMTGRNPKQYLIEKADYVSEIKKIKHPFDNGVMARKGIEL